MLFLMDTNILLAFIRLGSLGLYLDATYSLYTLRPLPLVSVVTEGELRALALKHNWGPAKIASLQRLLNPLRIVPLPYRNIVEAYATIDDFCERNGHALGKNDIWIAATANVTRATLLTTDRDFEPLHGRYLQCEWVSPNSRI
jgi:tRNA(fMet)-specific endonuclease VapC